MDVNEWMSYECSDESTHTPVSSYKNLGRVGRF